MLNAIKNLPEQFAWQPKIENKKYFQPAKSFIVLGMGGSHLAADLLKLAVPNLPVFIYSDYGLPKWPDNILKQSLIIASSYSGNTEEVLDGVKQAQQKNCKIVCVAVGGALIEFAKKNNLPFIQLPNTGIQPRMALGFSAKALAKIMNLNTTSKDLSDLANTLKPSALENSGKKLAKILKNKIPVIYSSATNQAIAYNWKIKLNETGKVPAFYNVLPELNHNEMNGFDVQSTTKELSAKFFFIFLSDATDSAPVQKRMKILAKLYKARKLPVLNISLSGKNIWQKIFSNLTTADWTAYFLAKSYQLEPEPVPMVEEFKKMMR